MLRIAICDDEEIGINEIKSVLCDIEKDWEEKFYTVTFSSGESLCENLRTARYDIILLDIIMTGIDGLETARRMRAMGNDSVLVFVSSYDDKVKELFQFMTTAFLDKPVNKDKLREVLRNTKSLKEKRELTEVFSYKKDGTIKSVYLQDVIYFESYKNLVKIHTIGNEIDFTCSLKKVWEDVSQYPQFIMPHKSFIFNLTYATLKSSTIILNTSEKFNVGRNFKEETESRFFAYMEKRSS